MLKFHDILETQGAWTNPLDSQRGCHDLTEQDKLVLKKGLDFVATFSFKLRDSLRITDPNKIDYSPKKDRLQMPIPNRFKTVEHYLISLFHEYGHATGHPKRLNRPSLQHYYDKDTNILEEITAELTALKLGKRIKLYYDWINCYRYIMTFLSNDLMNNVYKLMVLEKANRQANNAVKYLLGK